MKADKRFVLVGNIIQTLAAIVLGWLSLDKLIIRPLNVIFHDSAINLNNTSNRTTIMGVMTIYAVTILIFYVILPLLTWLAYAKMNSKHGHAWRIFILIIGIFSALKVIFNLNNPIAFLLNIIIGFLFIFSWLVREKNETVKIA